MHSNQVEAHRKQPALFHFTASSYVKMGGDRQPWWATCTLLNQCEVYDLCPECNRRIWRRNDQPAVVIDADSKRWPDIMESPLSSGAFLASSRVCDALSAEGISGYTTIEAHIVDYPAGMVGAKDAYYLLEYDTLLQLKNLRHPTKPWFCPYCSARHNAMMVHLIPDHVVWESWDGTDFVMVGRRPRADLRVSRRVVDLAHQHRWTGLQIWACKCGHDELKPNQMISHLDDEWPPESWFL